MRLRTVSLLFFAVHVLLLSVMGILLIIVGDDMNHRQKLTELFELLFDEELTIKRE